MSFLKSLSFLIRTGLSRSSAAEGLSNWETVKHIRIKVRISSEYYLESGSYSPLATVANNYGKVYALKGGKSAHIS